MLPLDPQRMVPESRPGHDPSANGGTPAYLPAAWTGAEAPAGLPPGLSAGPGVGTMVHAVRRRWLLMLTVGLLSAGLVGAATWFLVPRKYTAESLLEFDRPPRGSYDGEFDIASFKRNQAAVIKSYPVLQAAVKKLDAADLGDAAGRYKSVSWLQKNVVTDELLLGPAILRVTVSDDDPEHLPAVLNAVTTAYLQVFAANEKAKVAVRVKHLQDTYRASADVLRDKRQKLRARKEALGLDDPETIASRYQAAVQQLAAAQNQQIPIDLEAKKAEVELAAAQAKIDKPDLIRVSDYAVMEQLRQNDLVKAHLARLAVIEAKIQEIKAVTTTAAQPDALRNVQVERSNEHKALAALLRQLKPQVRDSLRDKALEDQRETVAKEEIHVKLLREQKKALDAKVRRLESECETLRLAMKPSDKLPPDMEDLANDVAQAEAVQRKVGDELGTIQIGAGSPQVERRDLAQTAQLDVRRQIKVAGLAGFGVFALIFAGLVLLESRHRRVYAADDLVHGLGMNLVGTLPALPPQARRAVPAAGSVPNVYWQSIMTESVDVIRTVLLHQARGEGLRVVMVTSAVGGEGKTSLASHLAASLARSWRKTLLIDGDLRNPAAHQQFDLPLEPGFSEVLRGEVEYDDAVRPTPVSRLWLMPAGKWDSHAIQALAQEGVRTIFDRLKEQYDFIVIDACPVLPVADSLLLGQHADAALFSVLRDVSRMPAVYAAHQRLAALGIRMLGAVVIGEKVQTYTPGYHLTHTPG